MMYSGNRTLALVFVSSALQPLMIMLLESGLHVDFWRNMQKNDTARVEKCEEDNGPGPECYNYFDVALMSTYYHLAVCSIAFIMCAVTIHFLRVGGKRCLLLPFMFFSPIYILMILAMMIRTGTHYNHADTEWTVVTSFSIILMGLAEGTIIKRYLILDRSGEEVDSPKSIYPHIEELRVTGDNKNTEY